MLCGMADYSTAAHSYTWQSLSYVMVFAQFMSHRSYMHAACNRRTVRSEHDAAQGHLVSNSLLVNKRNGACVSLHFEMK